MRNSGKQLAARACGILKTLQLLARLESYGFSGGNVDLFSCSRITANPGLARPDAENTEAPEFDALAATQSILQRFKYRFHGLFGFGAADIRRGDHGIYDVELNHRGASNASADARG